MGKLFGEARRDVNAVEKATGLAWLSTSLAAMPDESAWATCTAEQEEAARAVTSACP